jgi:hypothetical protein
LRHGFRAFADDVEPITEEVVGPDTPALALELHRRQPCDQPLWYHPASGTEIPSSEGAKDLRHFFFRPQVAHHL